MWDCIPFYIHEFDDSGHQFFIQQTATPFFFTSAQLCTSRTKSYFLTYGGKQNTIKKDGSIMIVTVAILYHNNRTRKWIISYLGLWKFTEISISSMDEKSFPRDLMATAGGMPHFQTHTHTVVLYICTHNYIYINTTPGQEFFLLTGCRNSFPLDSSQVSYESHRGSRISWFALQRFWFIPTWNTIRHAGHAKWG